MTDIQVALFSMQDPNYKKFQSSLMPTVPADQVIGVRMPALRKFAKSLQKGADDFLNALPHAYYEENNLHALMINKITDVDQAIYALERFLPFVNNWATCDMIAPKAFAACPEELMRQIRLWLNRDHIYTVRYAIGALMRYYLNSNFTPEFLSLVAGIHRDEYYVNMMIAWYFATALAKQYDATVPYLIQRRLSKWCHNKTIQKATESYRIDPKQKIFLKTLKY